MIYVNGTEVIPTIFPDKTSQVWKVGSTKYFHQNIVIQWNFESEAEVMHVLQLVTLIRSLHHDEDVFITLDLPYLPYARQDKEVSNETTFALHTFLGLMAQAFDGMIVFDPHSKELLKQYFGDSVTCVEPVTEILDSIKDSEAEVLCFPDVSASKRYPSLAKYPFVYMEKVRDQSTGEITGMTMHGEAEVKEKNVLIVDDLCDGGRTFREAAKILYQNWASEVNLYISHGIFSHEKGVLILHEDGIQKVYDKGGIVSDVEFFTQTVK